MSTPSVALSNLRAVVILIVLAFHSVLAYLGSLPSSPAPFNDPPYEWRTFPIIDSDRWFGFDLFCAHQDVYLMSLMFLLSGLFVWPSLTRKKSLPYVCDRLLRIGLPFVLIVYLVMPLVFYPVYLVTAADTSLAGYWQHLLALPFWPSGPQWFLWQLLALNLAAAALYRFAPSSIDGLAERISRATPLQCFGALVIASAAGYVPLAITFNPWDWTEFGPFAVQMCRPLHYIVYFFAGLAAGAHGLDNPLLSANGMLARRWKWWLAAAFSGFLLWIVPAALVIDKPGGGPLLLQVMSDVGFAVGCATSCFFFVAFFLRFGTQRVRALDSLSQNAYGIYLIHYLFVVWLQYALLGVQLIVFAKVAIVFGVTLLLSWVTTAVLRSVPLGARLFGAERMLAKAP